MPKTGTSSLQAFLSLNKMALWNRGFAYPWSPKIESEDDLEITSGNGEFLGRADFTANGPNDAVVENFDKPFVNLKGERNIILSSEYFAGWGREKYEWLYERVSGHGYDIKFVCYLRDQGDMAVAHFFQEAKRNPNFDTRKKTIDNFLEYYSKLPYCDFESFLGMAESLFGANAMVVRPFNRAKFRNGDVIFDFLEILGVPEAEWENFRTEFKDINITPQQRDMFFRLKMTKLKPNIAYSDALLAGAAELYGFDERDHSANIFVDPELVETVRAKFVEGNKAVADRWFDGHDPAEMLKPKRYKSMSEMEVTQEDLYFWLLWTNSALIKAFREQNRLIYKMRQIEKKLS
jgi:hypothetical protein